MFVHGIPFRYIPRHFPVLNATCASFNRSREQMEDARHLIEQFGFEPVHFLRTSNPYPLYKCMEACFRFGDTLLLFNTLPFPRLQLSPNEWGVREVDLRHTSVVISRHLQAQDWFRHYLPGIPFFLDSDKEIAL